MKHPLLLRPSQRLFCCGRGFFSSLLPPNTPAPSELTPVELFSFLLDDPLDEITKIVMNNGSVMILTRQGRLLGCGRNQHGVLMMGDSTPRPFPSPCKFFHNRIVTDVALSHRHALVVTQDGQVYSCGVTDVNKKGETVCSSGDKSLRPHEISHKWGEPIVKVMAFPAQSFFLTRAGRMYACGMGYGVVPVQVHVKSGGSADLSMYREVKATDELDFYLAEHQVSV